MCTSSTRARGLRGKASPFKMSSTRAIDPLGASALSPGAMAARTPSGWANRADGLVPLFSALSVETSTTTHDTSLVAATAAAEKYLDEADFEGAWCGRGVVPALRRRGPDNDSHWQLVGLIAGVPGGSPRVCARPQSWSTWPRSACPSRGRAAVRRPRRCGRTREGACCSEQSSRTAKPYPQGTPRPRSTQVACLRARPC
jgi:hypothetical protein